MLNEFQSLFFKSMIIIFVMITHKFLHYELSSLKMYLLYVLFYSFRCQDRYCTQISQVV